MVYINIQETKIQMADSLPERTAAQSDKGVGGSGAAVLFEYALFSLCTEDVASTCVQVLPIKQWYHDPAVTR